MSQARKWPIKSLWELALGVNRVLILCYKIKQIHFYFDFFESFLLFNQVKCKPIKLNWVGLKSIVFEEPIVVFLVKIYAF